MISLSQSAANEIRRLQASREAFNTRMRINVSAGGCSGLYYTLDLENSLNAQESDLVYNSQDITIVTNKQSDNYLQGLHLDFSEDLMGGGFRFHNPNAQSTCGCGISFSPN